MSTRTAAAVPFLLWSLDASAQIVTNQAPILNPIGPRQVVAGQTLQFPISASDPDGDTLHFAIAAAPPGSTLVDHFNGIASFTFPTTPAMAGSRFDPVFSVNDGKGGSDSEQVRIDVLAPPPTPTSTPTRTPTPVSAPTATPTATPAPPGPAPSATLPPPTSTPRATVPPPAPTPLATPASTATAPLYLLFPPAGCEPPAASDAAPLIQWTGAGSVDLALYERRPGMSPESATDQRPLYRARGLTGSAHRIPPSAEILAPGRVVVVELVAAGGGPSRTLGCLEVRGPGAGPPAALEFSPPAGSLLEPCAGEALGIGVALAAPGHDGPGSPALDWEVRPRSLGSIDAFGRFVAGTRVQAGAIVARSGERVWQWPVSVRDCATPSGGRAPIPTAATPPPLQFGPGGAGAASTPMPERACASLADALDELRAQRAANDAELAALRAEDEDLAGEERRCAQELERAVAARQAAEREEKATVLNLEQWAANAGRNEETRKAYEDRKAAHDRAVAALQAARAAEAEIRARCDAIAARRKAIAARIAALLDENVALGREIREAEERLAEWQRQEEAARASQPPPAPPPPGGPPAGGPTLRPADPPLPATQPLPERQILGGLASMVAYWRMARFPPVVSEDDCRSHCADAVRQLTSGGLAKAALGDVGKGVIGGFLSAAASLAGGAVALGSKVAGWAQDLARLAGELAADEIVTIDLSDTSGPCPIRGVVFYNARTGRVTALFFCNGAACCGPRTLRISYLADAHGNGSGMPEAEFDPP